MYAREKKRMRMLYGFTPSVPTIPSLITVGLMHCAAQSIAIARIGAVVRLRCRRGTTEMRVGIETGWITKTMEMMKTTKVVMECPLVIAGY